MHRSAKAAAPPHTNEPALIENLRGTGVPMVEIPQEDTTDLNAAFDKI